MNRWFSAQELTELQSLPSTPQGINKKAKLENWEKRQVNGKQGISYEYAFTSLPQKVQAEIILKEAQTQKLAEPSKKKNLNYLPDVVWKPWQTANERQKSVAQYRLTIVKAIAALKATGLTSQKAIALVANEYNESAGTIKRWFYDVQSFEQSDWLPLLLDKKYAKRRQGEAEFTEVAWEAFKADYLRNEKPAFNVCYYRLQRAAQEQGWIIPSSQTVKRKLEREVPLAQQIYLREGEHALSRLYPAMQRSVAEIEAMEWINGDGYQHNVFVRWHNGEIVRPKTWIWQDIRTRKILAYRTDLSENSDTIRLSLMDVIYKYGIPRKLTIDNTRAAANKWMTGGVKNRYRFKVKEDDVVGIIPLLGIELYWTSIQFGKGHGQAKPIERAFSHGVLGAATGATPVYVVNMPSIGSFGNGRTRRQRQQTSRKPRPQQPKPKTKTVAPKTVAQEMKTKTPAVQPKAQAMSSKVQSAQPKTVAPVKSIAQNVKTSTQAIQKTATTAIKTTATATKTMTSTLTKGLRSAPALGVGMALAEGAMVLADDNASTQEKSESIGAIAGATAGAIVGQALIPIPVVGAMVGSYVGDWLGSWLGSEVGKKLAEPAPQETKLDGAIEVKIKATEGLIATAANTTLKTNTNDNSLKLKTITGNTRLGLVGGD